MAAPGPLETGIRHLNRLQRVWSVSPDKVWILLRVLHVQGPELVAMTRVCLICARPLEALVQTMLFCSHCRSCRHPQSHPHRQNSHCRIRQTSCLFCGVFESSFCLSTAAHHRCSQDMHLESRLAIVAVRMESPAPGLYDSSCGEDFWVVGCPVQERTVCFVVPQLVLVMEAWRKLQKVGGGAGVN